MSVVEFCVRCLQKNGYVKVVRDCFDDDDFYEVKNTLFNFFNNTEDIEMLTLSKWIYLHFDKKDCVQKVLEEIELDIAFLMIDLNDLEECYSRVSKAYGIAKEKSDK